MCINEEFNNALKNQDNILIMSSASKQYARYLSIEELDSCKMLALFDAIKKYKPNSKMKFTTFLYRRVIWECGNFIKSNKNRYLQLKNYDISYKQSNIHEYINDDNKEILEQRLIGDMTFKEIGEANGYSHETARQRFMKAIKSLKKYL